MDELTETVLSLAAYRKLREAKQINDVIHGRDCVTHEDRTGELSERIERIKESIARINTLMAELRSMTPTQGDLCDGNF